MNDIRLKDATRILKKNGYVLEYVNGSHYQFFNKNRRRITLPFHVNRKNSCSAVIWNKIVKEYNIKY